MNEEGKWFNGAYIFENVHIQRVLFNSAPHDLLIIIIFLALESMGEQTFP